MSFLNSLKGSVDKLTQKVQEVTLNKDNQRQGTSTNHSNSASNGIDVNSFAPLHQDFYGPYLRCAGTENDGRTWKGSILIVTKNQQQHHLDISGGNLKNTSIVGDVLAQHEGYQIIKFSLVLPIEEHSDVQYHYSVYDVNYSFHVPSQQDKPWRMMFFSCNGFSSDVSEEERKQMGGLENLWKDVMNKHGQQPFHLMIGGGDQVYADPMWATVPALLEWLDMKGKENRKNHPWDDRLDAQVSRFYFALYANHFNEPVLKDAMASIPCISTMDDHDAWDGFGSYPEILQTSNVFQNCGRLALYFYLLFQHHTTPDRASRDGLFGKGPNYNLVEMFGSDVAVALLDTRSERSLTQVVSNESYNMIYEKMRNLPSTTKHMILVTGVPLAYPRLEAADKAFEVFGKVKDGANNAVNAFGSAVGGFVGKITGDDKVSNLIHTGIGSVKKGLGKSGIMHSMINKFGLPELSDDLCDHWTNDDHLGERKQLVENLQRISQDKRIRVTLIAGDVHCGAVGRFVNASDANNLDHHYMVQITSSAIGNVPPPVPVIAQLNKSGQRTFELNSETKEEMMVVFNKDVDGKDINARCLGRRNYCIIGKSQTHPQGLDFTLMVENVNNQDAVPYVVPIPDL